MSRHSLRRTDNGCAVIFSRHLQCSGATYLKCWAQHGQHTTLLSYALLLFFHFESFSTKTAAFCPCAGPGSSVVVLPDEALHLIPEILGSCEYATLAGSALHLAEPARNRVQPGSLVGVRWKRHRGWTLGHDITSAVLWVPLLSGIT